MINTLIVYAHPYDKSFNHEILQVVETSLKKKGKSFSVLDLYKDGFNGQYSAEELKLYTNGETSQSIVKRYQKLLLNCQRLIFIFPIWWNDTPAIVKGFIDMVFKKGTIFVTGRRGSISGSLTSIKSVEALTTSTSSTWRLQIRYGNAIRDTFLDGTFKQLGIKNRKWRNFGQIGQRDVKARHKYLENLIRDL